MDYSQKDLQGWANENEPGDVLVHKSGYWDQIVFVRDTLSHVLFREYEIAQKKEPTVISTHVSKSIVLPVYQFDLPEGVVITIRYNFHDWKISIFSEKPIEADFLGLFKPDQNVSAVYCEGFPEERVYPCYTDNKKMFTVELSNQYHVYTFFWILQSS